MGNSYRQRALDLSSTLAHLRLHFLADPTLMRQEMEARNLLDGRARTKYLHPFVYPEVSGDADLLDRVIARGLLPPITCRRRRTMMSRLNGIDILP